MKTIHRETAGISNIWVVLLLPVLVGFVGLTIDIGYMVLTAQQLQIGADAGALAGVQRLRTGDLEGTRAAAQNTTGANTAAGAAIQLEWNGENDGDGNIVIGRFNREEGVFTPTEANPNAVMVVAQRTPGSLNGPLPLLFGPALGINTANMARSAIAMFGGGTGAGLIVLEPHERHAFHIKGNSTLQVNGGNIQINSDHIEAAYFQGSALDLNPDATDAGQVNIVGGYKLTGNPSLPPINMDGVEPYDDPIYGYLSGLGEDALSPMDYYPELFVNPRSFSDVEPAGGVYNVEPGYYPGGIRATGGTLRLAPGIYALDGDGLYIGGNANLEAEGVLFYIKGTGAFRLGGTGSITITPIEDTIYDGMSVFQAYGNTNTSTIIGNASMELEGAFYFPNGHLDISGDSITLGSQLIVSTVLIDGNGTVTINYEGKDPGVGAQTFLVR